VFDSDRKYDFNAVKSGAVNISKQSRVWRFISFQTDIILEPKAKGQALCSVKNGILLDFG
jgi:hypothetical protein